jgi:RNA polymerase-binding transcription factor DksA
MADQHVDDDTRARLEVERAQLHTQLDELASDADEAMSFDENFADSAQVAAEQGENRALATTLREQLADVDRALDRLDQGTYGRCTNCNEPIAPERLAAMPATARCIRCA